jgi:uncharacterized protein
MEEESTVADRPSALKVRLDQEIRESLRGGDKVRLSALRLLSAAVTVREKEVRHRLSDDEIRDVAMREAKKRAESIEAYESAGREELVAREREERDALAPYLPEQLTDGEVDAIVDRVIASTGATSVKQLGDVMRAAMASLRGRADGTEVQRKVRARLESAP